MSAWRGHSHNAFRYVTLSVNVKPHYVRDGGVLRCITLVRCAAQVTLRRGWRCEGYDTLYGGVWLTVCGYGALCGCVTGYVTVRYGALRYGDSTNVH